jgi:hypothetical protein
MSSWKTDTLSSFQLYESGFLKNKVFRNPVNFYDKLKFVDSVLLDFF